MLSPAPLFRWPWPSPLREGRLLRRYHRFLCDIELPGEGVVVAHCVNSGTMEGLVRRGARVWVQHTPGEGKKLQHTWEMMEIDGVPIGTNTANPNRLVRAMLEARALPGFEHWKALTPERRYGARSRVDFHLRMPRGEHFLEVKNCHLVYDDGRGYFPDSVSQRGTHHLQELIATVENGAKATVLFTVQRNDCRAVRPSDIHDPAFARAAREAKAAGVSFKALRIEPTLEGLIVHDMIPVDLKPYKLDEPNRCRAALRPHSGWERPKRTEFPAP